MVQSRLKKIALSYMPLPFKSFALNSWWFVQWQSFITIIDDSNTVESLCQRSTFSLSQCSPRQWGSLVLNSETQVSRITSWFLRYHDGLWITCQLQCLAPQGQNEELVCKHRRAASFVQVLELDVSHHGYSSGAWTGSMMEKKFIDQDSVVRVVARSL